MILKTLRPDGIIRRDSIDIEKHQCVRVCVMYSDLKWLGRREEDPVQLVPSKGAQKAWKPTDVFSFDYIADRSS